jgi:hypothetical protein
MFLPEWNPLTSLLLSGLNLSLAWAPLPPDANFH